MGGRIETEVEIAAPPETVYAALADIARYGEWNPYLVEVRGTPEPGQTLKVRSQPAGREEMEYEVQVVAMSPPSCIRWEGGLPDRAQFRGDHRWELEVLGTGRTLLRHHETFTGELAGDIFEAAGDAIRGDFERMNEALKCRVETQDACHQAAE